MDGLVAPDPSAELTPRVGQREENVDDNYLVEVSAVRGQSLDERVLPGDDAVVGPAHVLTRNPGAALGD